MIKAPEVYFFDNGDIIGDRGARFENLIASTLIKRLHFLEDRDGYRYDLRRSYDRGRVRVIDPFSYIGDTQTGETDAPGWFRQP